MCEWLVKQGHKVSVMTAFPYYPEWRIHDSYKKQLFQEEIINGVNVWRSYVYVPSKVTTLRRILHELSFSISSWIQLIKHLHHRCDIVISICPPFQLGFQGIAMSFLYRCPLIYHIQDLQIDAAIDLGMIKSGFMKKWLPKLEKIIFNKATIITTISMGMIEKIILREVPLEKVTLFPNWSDIETIRPVPKNNEFRKIIGASPSDFIVLYAGNMGEKQGLDIVLDAANKLKANNNIIFIFVGEGARKQQLIGLARDLELNNVLFLPIQPKENLCEMLNTADICLVTQQKNVTDIVMPSKLTNIMASGTPALATCSTECEMYKVITRYKCGLVVEPENSDALANIINKLYQRPTLLKRLGKRGRQYAEIFLSKSNILKGLEGILINCINKNRSNEK